MAKVQKTYTRAFKEEAVRLVQSSGKPIAQIARELILPVLVESFPVGAEKTRGVFTSCNVDTFILSE